jgi:hypothetical protein
MDSGFIILLSRHSLINAKPCTFAELKTANQQISGWNETDAEILFVFFI